MRTDGVQLAASAEERQHLEDAYHELRTGLTAIRTHVELLRRALVGDPASAWEADLHIQAVGDAIDRLESLSRTLRSWHDEPAPSRSLAAPPR